MPKMNGRAAFAAMREINPELKALLASGYSIDGEAREILDEGMAGFIQKPFQQQKLVEMIVKVLNKSR